MKLITESETIFDSLREFSNFALRVNVKWISISRVLSEVPE